MEKTVLILVVLIAISSAQTDFSFTLGPYASNPSSKDDFLIGALTNGQTLSLTISLPNPKSPIRNIGTTLLKDGDPTFIRYQTLIIPQNGVSVTATFNIDSAGTYRFNLEGLTYQPQFFNLMKILIIVNGAILQKYVSVLKTHSEYPMKVIYLSQDTTINFGLTPDNNKIAIQTILDTLEYADRQVIDNSQATDAVSLKKGFHLVQWFHHTVLNTATFQSEYYLCPHQQGFDDVGQVFMPCLRTPNSLPSITTNLENVHQSFVLQAHGCSSRQYFDGQCRAVNPACNTFNPQADQCYTCNDGSRPVGGKCPSANNATTNGTNNGTNSSGNGNNSIPLPPHCEEVDLQGKCFRCKVYADLIGNGICQVKTCTGKTILEIATGNCVENCNPKTQQRINNLCYNKPPNCAELAPHITCQRCESGFRFVDGNCVSFIPPGPLPEGDVRQNRNLQAME